MHFYKKSALVLNNEPNNLVLYPIGGGNKNPNPLQNMPVIFPGKKIPLTQEDQNINWKVKIGAVKIDVISDKVDDLISPIIPCFAPFLQGPYDAINGRPIGISISPNGILPETLPSNVNSPYFETQFDYFIPEKGVFVSTTGIVGITGVGGGFQTIKQQETPGGTRELYLGQHYQYDHEHKHLDFNILGGMGTTKVDRNGIIKERKFFGISESNSGTQLFLGIQR